MADTSTNSSTDRSTGAPTDASTPVAQRSPDRPMVYGAGWCPDVRRSRALLDRLGVAHDYVDVEADAGAEKVVRALQGGPRRIPTVVFPDGAWLVEPSDEELAAVLSSGGSSRPRQPVRPLRTGRAGPVGAAGRGAAPSR